jgi:capsular polysaccharide biosynthesis protein
VEEQISLVEIFQLLKKKINFILLLTICAVTISGIVNFFFLNPIYQAKTQILVNQTSETTNEINAGAIQTNLQLINTYSLIIKSPVVLDEVVSRLDDDVTEESLQSAINVNSENNTQIINLSVQHEDPKMAAAIANTTAEVFEEKITNLMKVENVSILSKAKNGLKVKPNALFNTAVAMVLGLFLGVAISFAMEYLNTSIKSEQDIEKTIGVPVLGVVSQFDLRNSR